MTNLLSCFFPTTVVLVDDNGRFLDSLAEDLHIPGITFKKFTLPSEALAYINNVSGVNRLDCSDLVRRGEEGTSDWKSILLNVNRLHQEIYNIDRFSRISAIVADYSMPEMHGLEFCSNIDDSNIQKILLTGIADEKVAIDAFNERLISLFVKKEARDFVGEVAAGIKKLVHQYFSIHTNDVSKHLSIQDKTCLKDPVFANFFFSTGMSKDYVEYYMLDTFGGYLFLDFKGNPSLLSVLTENEVGRMVDSGQESGDLPEDVLQGLRSREYMIVHHSRSGSLPPVKDWGKYLKRARRLDGYQTYYFSFGGAESLDLDFERIRSFEQFKNSV